MGADGAPEPVADPRRAAELARALPAPLITLPAALDAQLQRDAGINHFEYVVMAMLSEQPDHALPMSQLSSVVAGSLSRSVQRGQAAGGPRVRPP